MAFLPLHAAGYHAEHRGAGPGGPAAPRTVLDRVVSSYTTTVGALEHARARGAGAAGADHRGRTGARHSRQPTARSQRGDAMPSARSSLVLICWPIRLATRFWRLCTDTRSRTSPAMHWPMKQTPGAVG